MSSPSARAVARATNSPGRSRSWAAAATDVQRSLQTFEDRVEDLGAQPRAVFVRARHHRDPAARLGHQGLAALRAERVVALFAQFLEQFLIALMRPLLFARVFDVVKLVTEAIFCVHFFLFSLFALTFWPRSGARRDFSTAFP